MQQQGWKQGQSLGARGADSPTAMTTVDDAARLAAARVGVLFKDDTLGLGAQLKSKDVAHQRTGLDAFQGLLGRLNGKSEEEVKEAERKNEDRNLAMYAAGKWGGMVFVSGGVLVQGDEYKNRKEAEKKRAAARIENEGHGEDADADRSRLKDERRRRKEERRLRREQKAARKAAKRKAVEGYKDGRRAEDDSQLLISGKTSTTHPPDEPVSSTDEDTPAQDSSTPAELDIRRESAIANDPVVPSVVVTNRRVLQNGRHILRGRNIQAKKKVFSDVKALDEVSTPSSLTTGLKCVVEKLY